MLTNDEIKTLSKIVNKKAFLSLFLDWLFVALIFIICARYPNPLIIVISMILIARTQLALALLMHDASHFRLFSNRKINDYTAQFLCCGPIFFSLYSYRNNHLKHHKNPLASDDPDITLIGGYPITQKSFLRKILRDLSGLSYFKFIHYFLYGAHKRKINMTGKKNIPIHSEIAYFGKTTIFSSIFISNILLILILIYFDQFYLYFILWILPSITFLQLLLRIRGIAEHAGYQPNENQSLNARTIINPWQTFFFAPHNVNYHIEHHLYVAIPFYNLPKAHQLLISRNKIPKDNFYTNYLDIISELIIKKSP